MTDSFGNYLCQRLLLNCSEGQRIYLMKKVIAKICKLPQ